MSTGFTHGNEISGTGSGTNGIFGIRSMETGLATTVACGPGGLGTGSGYGNRICGPGGLGTGTGHGNGTGVGFQSG